jgi:hypothetical protein
VLKRRAPKQEISPPRWLFSMNSSEASSSHDLRSS